ncbi:MAG: hypothetical protein K2X03_08305 [Bryobacteraceae bacterium]|nr:hypothetical protein [Bryobacteraceae bacterium]
MEDAGQKLKRTRERLNLRYRDVEEASQRIAERQKSDEFVIALSRLADIENKGTVPSIYRLYSLCTIYRLDLTDVLAWYGVPLHQMAADSLAALDVPATHPMRVRLDSSVEVPVPLSLDPSVDFRRTTYITRLIQRWGRLPLMLLGATDLKGQRYAVMGSDDWSMYPFLPPGAILLIDENKRKIAADGWRDEHERPIYFVEHRQGFAAGWCSLVEGRLIMQFAPGGKTPPRLFAENEADIVGQVVGVASRLDVWRRR